MSDDRFHKQTSCLRVKDRSTFFKRFTSAQTSQQFYCSNTVCERWKEKHVCTCTFVCVLLFYSSSILCLHFFLQVLVCDLKYSVCFLFFSKVSLCLKQSMFISTRSHPSSSYAGICALIVFCVKVLFGGISRCTTGSFVSEADALTLPLSSSS